MKRPGAEVLDITRWPSIDMNALETQARRRYQQRATAVEYYTRGLPIDEVEEKTRLDRRTLYRMIERALKAHPDGRPWGFRALIPGLRTAAYERPKKVREGVGGSRGRSVNCSIAIENLSNGAPIDPRPRRIADAEGGPLLCEESK